MNFKNILAKVAPFIASMIGGPFAGAATRVLSETLLGKDNASIDELEDALSKASPEQLVKLKQADYDYKIKMKEFGIDEIRLLISDKSDARSRETMMKDKMPAILGISISIGFFAVLILVIFYPIPPDTKSIVQIMFGCLCGNLSAVVAYYFGYSHALSIKGEKK